MWYIVARSSIKICYTSKGGKITDVFFELYFTIRGSKLTNDYFGFCKQCS